MTIGVPVVLDLVDHEDVGRRQPALDRGDDLPGRRGGDLHTMAGTAGDLLEEVQIRRLGGRDGQHSPDEEQRQDSMLAGEVPGKYLHDGRIRDPDQIPDEGDAAPFGDRLGHGAFGDHAEVDEDLTEKTMVLVEILLLQREFEIRGLEMTAGDQDLTEGRIAEHPRP